MIPSKVFFTKGVGKHRYELQSFELALRDAGIEKCNLVNVSSIFPPHCQVITKTAGIKYLSPGQIVHCVMARNCTNEPNRLLGSAIGVAVPKNNDTYGYISERHCFGETSKKMSDIVEDLAATMLATTLGLEFDPDKAWDERKQQYKMSGEIVRTQSIVQTEEADKDGLWTTVVAAAVFVEEI